MEMLRHYEQHWTTEQLCNQINLEKSQFYAYYRQVFHSSPHNDLLQVRLDKAKNLLTNEALRSNKWLFFLRISKTCLISADILNSSAVVRQRLDLQRFSSMKKSLLTDNNNQETSGSFYKPKSHKPHNIWYNVKKEFCISFYLL